MISFIFSSFIIWRIVLFITSFISEKYFTFSPSFPYSETLLQTSTLPSWIWKFANFDGVHYLTIAKNGYTAQYTQVFFPIYPLLMKLISNIFNIDLIASGLLISNTFFLISLIILWKLLNIDYEEKIIKWVIVFILLSPVSFFWGSVYSESLFFCFILLAFYFARKKKWILSGIFGGLSSASRLFGILLLPALLWDWYISGSKRKIKTQAWNGNQNYKIMFIFKSIFTFLRSPILFLVPLGLFIYMIYLQVYYGDWLYFWHAQPVFGAQRTGGQLILFPQVLWRYSKILFTVPVANSIFWVALFEVICSMVSLILLIYATRYKVRISYLIFSWLSFFMPTFTGTLSSMPRYTLILFPIYVYLALIKNSYIKLTYLLVTFGLLLYLTIVFTSGHWVS